MNCFNKIFKTLLKIFRDEKFEKKWKKIFDAIEMKKKCDSCCCEKRLGLPFTTSSKKNISGSSRRTKPKTHIYFRIKER